MAIPGIVDDDWVTLPVRLPVSTWDEPNLAFHEDPRDMFGIVTVNKLKIGNFYALLRYSSQEYVPTRGDERTFLQSKFEEKHEFMEMERNYMYEDPKTISSTGSVYYRCSNTWAIVANIILKLLAFFSK